MRDELSVQPILDGELLRAFAAFAETRNFTRAARRVGLSQPALFERVRKLSTELGAALYEREGRALRLTPAGVRVAAFARDMLGRAGSFAGELRGRGPRRVVTLAAGEGSYLYLLGPALQRFQRGASRPRGAASEPAGDAELRALTLGGPSTLAAVQRGEADLGVGVFDLVPEDIEAADIVETPLCAALRRQHPLARRRSVRLQALASERLILAPRGQKHRDVIGRAVASLGLLVTRPVEADGWPLMLSFAAAGLGVAIVNGTCKPPRGVVLRPIPELGRVTYRLIRRRGSHLDDATERLTAAILACGQR